MTRQRSVILEELRKVTTHPSADGIYEMVRKRLPRISLGTIYRNLEILFENGDIRRLDTGSHLRRFDGRAEDHYHCAATGWWMPSLNWARTSTGRSEKPPTF